MELGEDTDLSQPYTQSQQEGEPHLLGFITADIVGLRYYSGTVNGREMVALLREPLNPYDPNAIKVLNTRSIQVGHIDRTVAAAISPLIDSELITVEAIVPKCRSKTNRFRLPCQIHIFAPLPSFPTVCQLISESGIHLITQNDASFTLSESVAVKETRADTRFKNVDEIFRLVDESLTAKERVCHALEPPESIVRSKLMEHQKEGLWWLLNREKSEELPPFWEQGEGGEFVNVLTNYSTCVKPEPLRGGIFADAMGLGKTLTLLSLIALDKCGGKKKKGKKRRKIESGESSATLVVCPPSVFSTWILQLEEHTVPGSLRTCMYYGDRRAKNAEELMDYDLVLTTYSTLSMEEDAADSPVKKVLWRRIILDEAHIIKNSNARQSKMVISLNAKSRWAVTGTPIQNGSLDLFSLMAFLHFEPFSIKSYWRSLVQRPLNQGLQSGLTRLQVLMAAISLRRTKDNGLLGLPPKTIETQYVELYSEERELYDRVKEEATLLMRSFNNGTNNFPVVLSMLLRLRQICTDLALCPNDLAMTFRSTNLEDVSNNPQLLQKLVEMLQDGEDFECPICISPSADMVITRCAHIFCRVCILKSLQSSKSRCPLCRQALSESDLFSAPIESSKADSTASSSSSDKKLSSKASALIKFLKESREQNPAANSVVFSQFRKLLVLLEAPLKEAGFKTLRIDGSVTAKQRANVIDQFQGSKGDGPTILLASLRASGAGINLTAASTVYFMEPWWNPAVEEQAMDRIHRIGQTEAVKIVRLVAQDSIEEKILMLQEKKKELARETFRKRGSDSGGMSYKDLSFLISME